MMGLDMYLYKETYVGNKWRVKGQHNDKQDMVRVHHLPQVKTERIAYIVEEVAYWRKANAIHLWFVEHVQGGRDECQRAWVDRDKLEELKNLCFEVLAKAKLQPGQISNGYSFEKKGEEMIRVDHWEDGEVMDAPSVAVAQELLPTGSGFFFGSTDYDAWYLEDIKFTAETLAAVLQEDIDNEDRRWSSSFYYQSSW